MLPIELHYGIVEDNNDPERLGRMKVRVLPEMEGANRNHLPWLEPFNGGEGAYSEAQEKQYIQNGSPVWCFFSGDSFRTGWFFGGVFLEKRFDFDSVRSDINNGIAEENIGEYEDIVFSRDRMGTVTFRNTLTGVMGVYHKSGSYVIFSGSGDIIAYSKQSIKLYNDNNEIELDSSPGITVNSSTGNINFNGNSNSLVKYNELASILQFLISNLDTRIYIDPLSGVTGTVNPTHIHVTFDPAFPTKNQQMEASNLKTS